MTEARNVFNLGSPKTVEELTRILNGFFSRIGDRLDREEGLRGNPRFYSSVFEFPSGGLTVGRVLKVTSSTRATFGIQSSSSSSSSDITGSQLIAIYDENETMIHQFPIALLAMTSENLGFL